MKFTTAQIGAIADYQETNPDSEDLTPVEVAKILKKKEHELFTGEPSAEAPQPQKQQAAGGFAGPGPRRELYEVVRAERDAQIARANLAAARSAQAQPPARRDLPLAFGNEPVEGMEGFGGEDLAVGSLKIRQAMTQDGDGGDLSHIEEGHIFNTTNSGPGAGLAEVTLVLLGYKKGRVFLAPYDDDEKKQIVLDRVHEATQIDIPADWDGPICYSEDRQVPVVQTDPSEEGSFPPLAASCEGCQFAQWRTVGSSRLQDCGETYTLLAIDVTEVDGSPLGLPVRVPIRSTGIRPTKGLLTQLQLAARVRRKPVWGFSVRASTKPVRKGKNRFFVWVFGRPEPLPNDEIEDYGLLAKALVPQARQEPAPAS